MKPELTRSQLTALRRRGNTVVTAAAGSGKTTVLTEKIARLLRSGAKLAEMLVVTFTRDAAGQLREKIRKNLAEDAKKGDRGAEEHLAALPLAEIGTIHTFCGRVIRENFGLAGIPANFSVAEENTSDILMKKAMAMAMSRDVGARKPMRRIIWNAFWMFVTSVVSLVIRPLTPK